jgi:transcriptional regulator
VYIPKHFAISDNEKITSFLKQNNFGELVTVVEGKLFSSHLPFLFNEVTGTVHMHIAKANPQWRDLNKDEVLLIVNGPHGYVSPSWYHSPGVPTWNYQAVHIYGETKTIVDSNELKDIVDDLTKNAEKNYPKPWQPNYSANMLEGIVGIEMKITDIQCKFKLSQNRSKVDQDSVRDALRQEGNIALAIAMGNENR